MPDDAAATAAAAAAAAAGTTKPWYEGKADAEIIGHWQNRGWADKDATTIAIEATKAHREAEKFIGAPADQLLRMPKAGAPEADMRAFWGKLGAPSDAKDYDLAAVKDEKLATVLREVSASLMLPKDKAAAVAAAVVKHNDTVASEAAAVAGAALQTEKDALKKNWGANEAAHKLTAQNAVRALGIDPEAVNALESKVGYAKVMEMFRLIGSKIGEDKFVSGTGPTGGVMTREQATSKKSDLMKDTAWVSRYNAGGQAEGREMLALNTIIVGDETDTRR